MALPKAQVLDAAKLGASISFIEYTDWQLGQMYPDIFYSQKARELMSEAHVILNQLHDELIVQRSGGK